MKRFISFILVPLLTFVAFLGLYAQAPVMIRETQYIDYRGITVRTPNSSMMVIWDDLSSGSADIWAQKISPEGTPLWVAPRKVTANSSRKRVVQATLSSDSNVIILYEQISADYQRQLFIQKISTAGQVLWPSEGVYVADAYWYEECKLMVANLVGGAFVVTTPEYGSTQTIVHNYDSFGASLIPEPALYDIPASYLPEAVSDGMGGLIIKGGSRHYPNGFNCHLAHINSEGDLVGSNPLIPSGILGYDRYKLINTPQNEYILYCSDSSSLKAFKFDVNGNILFSSPLSIPLLSGPGSIFDATIMSADDGKLYYIAHGTSNDNQYFLTLGKLSSNGTPEWASPVVISETQEVLYQDISLSNDGSLWVAWSAIIDNQNWNECLLKASLITADGTLAFSPLEIGHGSRFSSHPTIYAQNNKAVLSFGSHSYDTNGVSCQTISNSGVALNPQGGLALRSVLNGDAALITSHSLGNRYIHIFRDNRYQGDYQLFYQISNSSISPVLEPNGRALNQFTHNSETYMDSITLPDNKTAILYSIYSNNSSSLYLQEIDTSGQLTYPEPGLLICSGDTGNYNIAKLSVYLSDIYIAWDSYGENWQSGFINGQRIDNGQAMWQAGGRVLIPLISGFMDLRALVSNYLVYERLISGSSTMELFTLAFNESGDPIQGWQPIGTCVATNSIYATNMCQRAGLSGENLLLFYNIVDIDGISCHTQLVDPTGNILLGAEGLVLADETEYIWYNIPDVAYSNDTGFLFTLDSYSGVYLQRLSADGSLAFDGFGTLIDYNGSAISDPRLIMFSSGDYAVVWSGWNDDISSINYCYVSSSGEITYTPALDLPSSSTGYSQLCTSSLGNSACLSFNQNTYYDLYRGDALTLTNIYAVKINPLPSSIDDPSVSSPVLDCSNYPNPFNPSTTIRYSIDKAQEVKLAIYNSKGQLVNTIVNQQLNAGLHEVVWDGKDSQGNAVASGIYLYKIQAGKYSQTKKMMLMK